MTPNIVYAGVVCLAALQTTQAFLIPSSFNLPGITKDKSVPKLQRPNKDVVNALPIAQESQRERMKNLHLGVSKPFPFTIPSGDDVEEANKKAKHYFKSLCSKLKHDASKAGNMAETQLDEAEDQLDELHRDVRIWWSEHVPSKVKGLEKEMKEFESDVMKHVDEIVSDVKDFDWSEVKESLEEDLEDTFHDGKAKTDDVKEQLSQWESEWDDIDWSEIQDDIEEDLEKWGSALDDIDWDEIIPMFENGDVQDDEEPFSVKPVPPVHHDLEPTDGVQRFTVHIYSGSDETDDSEYMYIELVNEQTGELSVERISLSDFEDEFDVEDGHTSWADIISDWDDEDWDDGAYLAHADFEFDGDFDDDDDNDEDENDGAYVTFADYDVDGDFDDDDDNLGKPKVPGIFGHKHIPNIHDMEETWGNTMRLSPHYRGRGRCTRSKFRHFMRTVASGLRTFVTGFLIPVLIGVAAGMAASLFGMLVGTLCGWLWVKIVHGGRRVTDEAEFVEYRLAGDGVGEKDTLLTVEAVESAEDAPPTYVEKE